MLGSFVPVACGSAVLRAEWLCLSVGSTLDPLRLRLEQDLEAQPQKLNGLLGKAQPFRTEGGKAAMLSGPTCQDTGMTEVPASPSPWRGEVRLV
jgi:hypothetical protein